LQKLKKDAQEIILEKELLLKEKNTIMREFNGL
jgi:hypothetical protein